MKNYFALAICLGMFCLIGIAAGYKCYACDSGLVKSTSDDKCFSPSNDLLLDCGTSPNPSCSKYRNTDGDGNVSVKRRCGGRSSSPGCTKTDTTDQNGKESVTYDCTCTGEQCNASGSLKASLIVITDVILAGVAKN